MSIASDEIEQDDQIIDMHQFLVVTVGNQEFGIAVENIADILFPQIINPIPLASKEVVGSINLRGRIVTALDIRALLDMEEKINIEENRCVVMEYGNELFSLLVDDIGDVVDVPDKSLVRNPDNLSKVWKEFSQGIFLMKEDLIVILDVDKIMTTLMPEEEVEV